MRAAGYGWLWLGWPTGAGCGRLTCLLVWLAVFDAVMVKRGVESSHRRFGDPSSTLPAGNNAVEMQTTAVFDRSTDEFVIHTPTPLAQK